MTTIFSRNCLNSQHLWRVAMSLTGHWWTWITGESVAYLNWDDTPAGQNEGGWPKDPIIHQFGLMRGFDHLGEWNNLNNQPTAVYGYLVEYPVPEPSSLLLLASLGVYLLRNHRLS
jgi:hypothetical protein